MRKTHISTWVSTRSNQTFFPSPSVSSVDHGFGFHNPVIESLRDSAGLVAWNMRNLGPEPMSPSMKSKSNRRHFSGTKTGKTVRIGIFGSVLLSTNLLRLPSVFSSRPNIDTAETAQEANASSGVPTSPIVKLPGQFAAREVSELADRKILIGASVHVEDDVSQFFPTTTKDALLDQIVEGIHSPDDDVESENPDESPGQFAAREVSELADLKILIGASGRVEDDFSYDVFTSSSASTGESGRFSSAASFGNGSGGGGGSGFRFKGPLLWRLHRQLQKSVLSLFKHHSQHSDGPHQPPIVSP